MHQQFTSIHTQMMYCLCGSMLLLLYQSKLYMSLDLYDITCSRHNNHFFFISQKLCVTILASTELTLHIIRTMILLLILISLLDVLQFQINNFTRFPPDCCLLGVGAPYESQGVNLLILLNFLSHLSLLNSVVHVHTCPVALQYNTCTK